MKRWLTHDAPILSRRTNQMPDGIFGRELVFGFKATPPDTSAQCGFWFL